MPKLTRALDAADVSRVIEMAWEDRTPFEAIKTQFGLDKAAVIAPMRQQLKPGPFRLWRDRAHGRKTKHATMRPVALKGAIGIRRTTERRSAEATAGLFQVTASDLPDSVVLG